MSEEAKRVLRYLQEECSDFWHVKENNNIIDCYYIDMHRFSISKDEDDDWQITGEEISLNMAYNLAIILNENY